MSLLSPGLFQILPLQGKYVLEIFPVNTCTGSLLHAVRHHCDINES